MEQNLLVRFRNISDGVLKFPNLTRGHIGIQIGFDFSSKNLTSDIIVMSRRVGPDGLVVGIDPDPLNHDRANQYIQKYHLPIKLVQKATYSHKTQNTLVLTERSSWNRLSSYAEDQHLKTARSIEVPLDTVDNIVAELGLSPRLIRHVNVTNNGSEYPTLLGMRSLLENTTDLALSIVAHRPGKAGIIDGRPDYVVIPEYLQSFGFKTKFYRMHQLIWWGGIHQLLLKRNNPWKDHHIGIVFAHKGKARHPWYQSFS